MNPPVPGWHWLLWGLLLLQGAERLVELRRARTAERRLATLGARPVRPDGYGFLVAVHAAWFAGLLLESLLRPVDAALLVPGLLLWAGGTALRHWAQATLGARWSTRVTVLPGEPPVRRGPYRALRHPIYVGVFLELLGLPLAFGLWTTAAGIAVLHAAALTHRIRIETRALRGAYPPSADAAQA